MELNGLLVWAAVLVSLIAFIVFLVKGFKQWGVWMTIGFVVLFIECWTFLVISAGVSKARLAALKSFDGLLIENKKLLADRDLEFYGSPTNPASDLQRFLPLSSELNRILLERGRTWRGSSIVEIKPNAIVLRLPSGVSADVPEVPGAPADAPAPAGAVSSLAADSVVYLFGEDQTQIPVAYLGEFKVTTAAGDVVTLVPTSPLNPSQAAVLEGEKTWAVYELIPLDSHTAFVDRSSQPSEDHIFGEVNPEQISNLLRIPLELAEREPSTLDVLTAIKARVLQSYLLDGSPAPENTPLENLFYEVTFLKDYEEAVDSTDIRKPTEGGYFDVSGRSVDARLMRGGEDKPSFKVEDVYHIYGPKAKELERDGIVKLGRAYFVRPLNDYAYGFREARRLTQLTAQDIALTNREIEVIKKTDENVRALLLKSEDDGRKLELDNGQYAKELAVISQEQSRISQEVKSKTAELGNVYSQILHLHAQVVSVQKNILNAVNASLAP